MDLPTVISSFTTSPLPNGIVGDVLLKNFDSGYPVGLTLGTFKDDVPTYLWNVSSLDFENQDCVLLYSCTKDQPFGITGDMLRISRNRRWFFGPSVGSPNENSSSFTFCCNPDTPSVIEFRPWYHAKPYDVKITKWSELHSAWIMFAREGDPNHCFRVGFIGDGSRANPRALAFYAGNGKPSSPEEPGELLAKLTEKGDLILSGHFRTGALPLP